MTTSARIREAARSYAVENGLDTREGRGLVLAGIVIGCLLPAEARDVAIAEYQENFPDGVDRLRGWAAYIVRETT